MKLIKFHGIIKFEVKNNLPPDVPHTVHHEFFKVMKRPILLQQLYKRKKQKTCLGLHRVTFANSADTAEGLTMPLLRGARRGRAPSHLKAACAPHFSLLKILFLEHHVTTKQQTIMEKGIILTFKHNSRLTFQGSLRNCWQNNAPYTRFYKRVAEGGYKPAESLPVLR